MKIGKYEFTSKEEAELKIQGLGTAQDEDGNEYPTHQNTIVKLGFLTLEQGTYDEEGSILIEPITSNKYSVDVLWDKEEDNSFASFRIDLAGGGSHVFSGWDYQKHKV